MVLLWNITSCPPPYENTSENNRHRQRLSPRQGNSENGNERILLITDKLNQEAENAVEDEEDRSGFSGSESRCRSSKIEKADERREQIGPHFVELDRVSQTLSTGESHSPRQRRHGAVEFLVDEVPQSSEREADRHGHNDGIGDGEEMELSCATEEPENQRHTDESSMRRHTAIPDGEYLEWVGKKVRRLIEEDVPESSSDNDAGDGP